MVGQIRNDNFKNGYWKTNLYFIKVRPDLCTK